MIYQFIRIIKVLFILIIFFFAFNPSAYAIDQSKSSKGLSKKEMLRRRQIFDIVKPPKAVIDPKKLSIEAMENAKKNSPINAFEIDESEGDPFLIPNLLGEGVLVDKRSKNAITATEGWSRDPKVDCTRSFSNEALCNRTKSVKEVLRRYSGSDEFYISHCQEKCEKDEIGLLIDFDILSPRAYSFKLVDSPEVCTVQLSRNTPLRWELVNISEVSCICLERQCEN